MTRQERRERELAERRQVIVNAARELAEAEGWESVTTRRLADRIEYSQPVLYSHFEGKDAIVTAVALEDTANWQPCCTPLVTRPVPSKPKRGSGLCLFRVRACEPSFV